MSKTQPQVNVILYSDLNCKDECVTVHASLPSLANFANKAQSAMVISGVWELVSSDGSVFPIDEDAGRYGDLGSFNQRAISIRRV